MKPTIDNLELRIQELELGMEKLKVDIENAIQFMTNNFSNQLQIVMEEYKKSLKKETIEFINNYKQH
ncbi:hypothetical protein [Paenibacillus sinopodophylli]|uniref:hypothetical protein n=1 Tax=Paenibacillus sinopodophylli TaxID=1837342 RepID=UPI00110CBDA4|nr:hypothetical protein [Paenibacillus sinopodophylli]